MSAPTTENSSSPTPTSKINLPAPRVFFSALAIILVVVIWAIAAPEQLGKTLKDANTFIVADLGWYYVAIVSGFVFFALWLAIAPMGNVVLGKDDDNPEFSLGAWFAMLFAAGMGIGLVFWGVAEPLNHFAAPPPGTGEDVAERADKAMDITFLHWGLHAWAIYVVVGLAIAYAVHRSGRPVSIRWALEPLLGDRVKGVLGDIIDTVAVVGTVFGVATSLGYGVSQVAAGLDYLGVLANFGVKSDNKGLLVVLIVLITGAAVVSVVTGLDKGIKFLSNLNMGLAAVLILTILALGPTIFLLGNFVQQIGSYLQGFFNLSFQTFSYEGDPGNTWLSGWTTNYWGWWMSWAPFVGVFIARISRGRTVREFILGVMLVPTLVTFFWFSIMGGTALHDVMGDNVGKLIDDEGKISTNMALFQMLDGLPAAQLLAIVAIFLVIVFFVTSSESGSFVVSMLSSGGNPNPPMWNRVMWGVLEGAVAAALLLAGTNAASLDALQTMSILVAAPFSIVMVLMACSVAKALMRDNARRERAARKLLAAEIAREIAEEELLQQADGQALVQSAEAVAAAENNNSTS